MKHDPPTILIVEDDSVTARYIEKILKENGYDVLTTVMLAEDLPRVLRETDPDLVIMDIRMGGSSDGIDLVRENIGSSIPVIYLTSYSDPETIQRAKATNPSGYLLKPVNANELRIAVEFALYRHAMEERSRMSELRYRTIVESLPILICRFLPWKDSITFVNNVFCEHLALDKVLTVGKPFTDVFPRLLTQRIREEITRIDEENAFASFEMTLLTRIGKRTYRWSIHPLLDADGLIAEYQLLGTDITDERRMLDELKTSEQKFAKIFRASPAGIAIVRFSDDMILDVNDTLIRTSGYTRDELVYHNLSELGLTAPLNLHSLRPTLQQSIYASFQTELRFKSGEVRSFIASAEIIEIANERCVLFVLTDITEQLRYERTIRESQQRYRLLADNMLDLIAMCDQTRAYIYVSPSHRTVLGYEETDLLGKDVAYLLHADDRDRFCEELDARWLDPSGFRMIFRLRHKDGRYLWFECYGRRILGEDAGSLGAVFTSREITARKKAEEELISAHRQFEDIIEFLPDATFAVDRFGRIIAWNRALERLTRVPKEQMIGKGDREYAIPFYGDRRPMLIDMLHPESVEAGADYLVLQYEGDTVMAETYISRLPATGQSLWLSARATLLRGANGEIEGAIQTMRDITDIRRMENALRESEEKFRLLFEESAEAQILYDSGIIVDCNMAAVHLFGAKAKEDINREAIAKLSVEVQPDGVLSKDKIGMVLDTAYRCGSLTFEWLHRRFDGTSIPMEVTLTVIPIGGKRLIHAMLRDITARYHVQRALKQSEEQYRTLVEAMNDGLVRVDRAGTITFTNERFSTMIGYDKQSVIGMRLIDFIESESRASFAEAISKLDGMARNYEVVLRSRSGQRIHAICTPRFISEDEGASGGIVAVFTDITERKRLERQILETSMREQQRIGRDLHDDMGQLLTGTGFLCENLVRMLEQKDAPEAREARKIYDLINEAKEHTRALSRGLSPVEVDSGGLTDALDRLVAGVRSLYAIDCLLLREGELCINDSMVETQFYYIAQEAVTNAIKHGRVNRIIIRTITRSDLFRMVIEDDGIGIPSGIESIEGMGIRIMRYRATAIGAALTIRKGPRGRGTVVACDWRRQ